MRQRIYLSNTYPDKDIIKTLPGAYYDGVVKKKWWISPFHSDRDLFKKWLPEDYGLRTRIYLNVPEEAYDLAEKAGALWEKREEGWWIDGHADREAFKPWLPRKYHPDHASPWLTINMIPERSHGLNLWNAFLTRTQWEALRDRVCESAGNRCTICGGTGSRAIECNEHWVFHLPQDASGSHIQKLERLEALCYECHSAVHMGLSVTQGRSGNAQTQLMLVNGWDKKTCHAHDAEAVRRVQELSQYSWDFDLSLLKRYGIDVLTPNSHHYGKLPRIHGIAVQWPAAITRPASQPGTAAIRRTTATPPSVRVEPLKVSWLKYLTNSLRNDYWFYKRLIVRLGRWIASHFARREQFSEYRAAAYPRYQRRRYRRRYSRPWFYRGNQPLFLVVLGGIIYLLLYSGFSGWALDHLSLGLRWAYWYVEKWRK